MVNSQLKMPGASHRLVGYAVGLLVAYEALRDGVELQFASCTYSNIGQMHEDIAAISVDLV